MPDKTAQKISTIARLSGLFARFGGMVASIFLKGKAQQQANTISNQVGDAGDTIGNALDPRENNNG